MSNFNRGKRENVNLLLGLAGGTGSGKTYTAFRLAAGICGDKPFAVIDTEARRALHYADAFKFDHAELVPPFTPERYTELILDAEKSGYAAIVIDSMSHEHESEGGLLDMQEAELQRMAGDDWKKREQCLQASWISPKRRHKKMVQRLLQVRSHLLICMRAEDKTELQRVDGKLKMVPKPSLIGLEGWIPICEKRLPFELTASFLLTATAPGIPKPIKLQEQHRALFPLDQPITEQSGKRISEWASGGATKTATPKVTGLEPSSTEESGANPRPSNAQPSDVAATISADEALRLEARCTDNSVKIANVKKFFKVERFSQMTCQQLADAHKMIDDTLAQRQQQ